MFHYDYKTKGTCSSLISFDLDNDKVHNVSFIHGCNGNLKAIGKLVEGMSVNDVERILKGNICGNKGTSCADQLATAVRKGYEESLK